MPTACVLLAPGFEEIEAVTVVDVLRRAGVETSIVAVGASPVTGSHDITVAADLTLAEIDARSFDAVVLPGGMPGAAHLRDDVRVRALVSNQAARGGIVAAICAGPIALAAAGVLAGKRATSYPGFEDHMAAARYQTDDVVIDGAIVTSRGPGTALRFALALVGRLCGETLAIDLGRKMLSH